MNSKAGPVTVLAPATSPKSALPTVTATPGVALVSGADGLDSSRCILQDAAPYLAADGLLALEVGAEATALGAAFPTLGFVWPEFEFGGEGIALISATALRAQS